MLRAISLSACLPLLCATLVLAPPTTAEQQPQAPVKSEASPPSPVPAKPVRTFDVHFKGGTLAEYVEAVRQASGSTANVVVMPAAAEIPMTEVALTSVSARSAIKSLNNVYDLGLSRLVWVKEIEGTPDEVEMFTVGAHDQRQVARPASQEDSKVWSLASIVQTGQRVEDVVSAVETALSLYPEAKPKIELRLHKDTNLLIARGRVDQLVTVEQVIEALTPPPQYVRRPRGPAEDPPSPKQAAAPSTDPPAGPQSDEARERSNAALREKLEELRAAVAELDRLYRAERQPK